MLSGETAVGEYPVEAVATMNRIAHEAERLLEPIAAADHFTEPRSRALAVTEAVTVGAVSAAAHLSADLIVLCTRGGKTALAVSRQRGRIPILGLTDSPETARRMCLYWGVSPICTPVVNEPPQKLLRFVVEWGMKAGLLRAGSKIVLVTRSNWSAEGHDLMLVHAIP
jgi:pyruvate kinase